MTRILIFGLDAASPSLIERWIDDLPNIRRLIQGGTWGVLDSTIPPFTSPAWACMATGKNPAKVGIFGLRQRTEGQYQFKPPNSSHRRAAAVWDIAGRAGKQSVVVNVPDTYPPSPVEGVMVSGRPAPVDPDAAITYPPDLREKLDKLAGGYQVGPSAAFDDANQPDELPVWEQVLQKQQSAFEHLVIEQPWDLAFYVSMAIDGVGHHFWKDLDPAHPEYDPRSAETYGDVLRQVYILEDRRLGRIMEQLSGNDLLLVVSDHGSAPCYRHIAVNRWLIDHGYLVLRGDDQKPGALPGTLAQLAFNLYGRSKLVRRLARPFRPTGLRDAVVQSHFARQTGRVPFDALPIDWSRTTAYYLGDHRLYLNLAGREPQGIIQPGDEYEQKREEIRARLLDARDRETSAPIFDQVYPREAIYSGPYMELAPDLILSPADPHHNLGGAVGDSVVDRPVVSGKHHPEGVFLAYGAGVIPARKLRASIYDITPTVLHALGVPVPDDADGKVRLEWFEPDSEIAQRPVSTASYEELELSDYQWTRSEQAAVEQRLRELGYLD
ncbi:MAG: alkaline phosphatase family protein [Anaerolineales bacterium]|nr:alkaline phosphatase family protein [Anaerolineales bacterium]